ncbi:hypothetical protein [Sulfolobus polyhedral virus 1]|uniref:Uncharacterized protein n=1 Tax=Sulfolobus polyhedral virus 1 TaxID=1982658 RepID=A0A1W6I159_SPV1|nr:hypothetical protein DT302_gp11 [Sulfolobus polyhedral virus 1]ARM37793.1 hypothetical protein [Sulfolobus polyhedral virus 1]
MRRIDRLYIIYGVIDLSGVSGVTFSKLNHIAFLMQKELNVKLGYSFIETHYGLRSSELLDDIEMLKSVGFIMMVSGWYYRGKNAPDYDISEDLPEPVIYNIKRYLRRSDRELFEYIQKHYKGKIILPYMLR